MFKTESLKPAFLKKIVGLKVNDEVSEKSSKIFKKDYELSNLKIELDKAKEIKSDITIILRK